MKECQSYRGKIAASHASELLNPFRSIFRPLRDNSLNPLSRRQTRAIPHRVCCAHMFSYITRYIFLGGGTRAIFARAREEEGRYARTSIVGYYLTGWRNVSRILTPCRPVFVKYYCKIRTVPFLVLPSGFFLWFGATATIFERH